MGKKHEKKYLINVLIAFILITTGLFTIIYLIFTSSRKFDWFFWAILTALLINIGLVFLGSAFVHKVKSDLIRRQKRKPNSDNSAGSE
jgi:O-antigen/teichoic acid export membrane protein